MFSRFDRWLTVKGFLSKTALALAGIGALLTLISFLKGIQVLMFIPAFVLALFLYSFFDVRSARRKIHVAWSKDKNLSLSLTLDKPHPSCVFFLAFEEGKQVEILSPTNELAFRIPKKSGRFYLLIQGKLGIFRAVIPLPEPPPARNTGENPEGDGEIYFSLEKYEEGDELRHIDALQTAKRQAWYLRKIIYEAPIRRIRSRYETLRFSVQSNRRLFPRRDISRGRMTEWVMVAVTIMAAHLEWRNILFTLLALASCAFVYLWLRILKWKQPGRRWMNATALSLFVGCFIEGGVMDDTVLAGTHFLILLAIWKHLFQRERRDAFTYIFLVLFVFVALSLYTLSAWFIFLFFIFLHLSVSLFSTYSAGEIAEEFTRAFETPPASRSRLLMSGIILVCTIALFFFLPHGSRGKDVSLLQKSEERKTGFDEEVSLNNVLSIKRDFSKKIVIENAKAEKQLEYQQLYWRGSRFTEFIDGKWKKPETDFKSFAGNFADPTVKSKEWLQIRYYFEGDQTLFFPQPPAQVQGKRLFFLSDGNDPTMMRLTVPQYNDTAVKAEFLTDKDGQIRSSAKMVFADLSHQIDPAVESLMTPFWDSLPTGLKDDPARLADYIRDEAGFFYSLEDTAPDLEAFLYSHKKGHCEYFATVLALTLQHFGYNATFVNGFQGGEWLGSASAWIIRGTNAHSWVEVFDSVSGWNRFEATPASGETFFPVRNSAMMRKITQFYDTLEIKWFEYFVSFTGERQKLFFHQIFHFRHEIFWLIIGQYLFRKTVPPLYRVTKTALARTPKERFLWWLSRKTRGKVFVLQLLEVRFPQMVKKTRTLIFGGQPAYEELGMLKKEWRRALRSGKDRIT